MVIDHKPQLRNGNVPVDRATAEDRSCVICGVGTYWGETEILHLPVKETPDLPDRIHELLCIHALWINTETGKQPKSCPCGKEFILGESFNQHIADAIMEEVNASTAKRTDE